LRLPDDCSITMISTPEDVQKLGSLMTAKLVGVDSEWKMHINVKEKDKGPAVLQLAS